MRNNLLSLIKFIKKFKERFALAGLGIAFVLFIGGGMYLQKSNKQDKEPQPTAAGSVSVELKTSRQEKGPKEAQPGRAAAPETTAYFLKPSPEELLQKLASMEYLKADVIDEKIKQMPVLWPAYFFAIRETQDGRKSIVLDVSENGFGVVIESEIDLRLYPELHDLKTGQKVWIGGKIMAVDPEGTGRIYIKSEQFRIGDDAPFLQVAAKKIK